MSGYTVYILECASGALYTGITTHLKRRFAEHKNGTGARYTRANPPKRIVYSKKLKTRSAASKREAEIKSWPRERKLEMIAAHA